MESDFRKKVWMVLVACILVIAPTMTLWAADLTGRIRGTVTDPTGAVVPNAAITAANVATGASYKASSSSTGSFELPVLPIGNYIVTVEVPGFQKYRVTDLTLNIDQVYVLAVTLKVATGTETVEVSASAVQVETTNIQLGNVVNSKQILDMPSIGRNFTTLQLLLPGVQGASDRFGSNQTGGAFSTNGSQSQQNSFLINGTDINDIPLNTPVYTPSPDAIEQFQFATSSLNAEYSRNSGAVVSASIKSGTNAFHGSVFEFYRDTFLNARNYFQTTPPVFHQNQFGGTFGGPILKDKAFFFVSYQGIRARQPQAVALQTVYTAAQRTGDFSNILGSSGGNNFGTCWPISATCVLGTPGTGQTKSTSKPVPGTIAVGGLAACAGMTWRQCLGNADPIGNPVCIICTGIIPGGAAGLNPIAVALMNAFVPLPNSGTNNFSWNPTQTVPFTHQGIARGDISVSSKDQLWGLFVYQTAPSTEDLPFTGATLPGFGSFAGRKTYQLTASWTHTFSPTTLNELRVGYTRFNFDAVEPQNVVQPSSVGFAINPQNTAAAGLPRMRVLGFYALGFSSNGPQPRLDENRQASDSFTKIAGNHSLKFGVDVRRFNVNNPFFAANNGSYTFNDDPTASIFGTGHADIDFLLGIPATYSQNSGALISAYAYETYAYAQDNWKVRPNLTLTFGLGWQVETPFHNLQFGGVAAGCYIPGQQSAVFPTAPEGLNYPGDPGCNDAQGATTQWKNVGPRLGFAWSPELGRLSAGNSGKFVVRGGVGIYYNRVEEESILQNLAFPPFGLNSLGAADFGQVAAFANPFQDIDTGVVNANKFPATFASPGDPVDFTIFEPFVQSVINENFEVPYAINYNLTIQRELPANIVATVSYVGSVGRKLQSVIELNPITQAGHDACLAGEVAFGFVCTSSTGRAFQPLLFPDHTLHGDGDIFASMFSVATTGKSSYNSLQISATKGRSHGLAFQASYTYSHALDDGSGFENSGFANALGGGSRGYNQFFPATSYGNSAFDTRHRFVFAPLYDIPNWKNLRGFSWMPDVIGKGWKISGIMTFASGFPFDISYAGATSRSLWCSHILQYYACPDTPDQTGALVLHDPRELVGSNTCWFTGGSSASTACGAGTSFTNEPIGFFGNTSRYKFHGPGLNNFDMLFAKDIHFWPGNENRYLELRFEMYNVFNHTQFNLPSGDFTSSSFGRITSAAPARLIQIGAKIYF